MYDIHCHILPCVDDGAVDIEDSIKICKAAFQDGIKTIIATPHYIDKESEQDKAALLEKVNSLNKRIAEEKLNINVLLGMEIYISDNLIDLLNQDKIITLNGTSYMLFELPLYNSLPNYLDEIIFSLELKKIIPIIAHPERYSAVINNPNTVYDLIEKGCLIQINSGSLEGYFGKQVQKTAFSLIEHNMVHFISSDNHSSDKRLVSLKKGYSIIKNKFGKNLADSLFIDNPRMLIENQYINIEDPKKIIKKKKFLF